MDLLNAKMTLFETNLAKIIPDSKCPRQELSNDVSHTYKAPKIRKDWLNCNFQFPASGDLGGRIWGHPVPLNRGCWATLDFSHDLKKCFLLWFIDIPNITFQPKIINFPTTNSQFASEQTHQKFRRSLIRSLGMN